MAKKDDCKKLGKELLALADVKINGSRPWDIHVHDDRFYQRVLSQGTLGLGESYMDGWWDVKKLDQFIYKVLDAQLHNKIKFNWNVLKTVVLSVIFNRQSKRRAYQIGEEHYDLDNELFRNMLDKRMNYSCGYWSKEKTLDKAQEAKLDLICKKLGLKKGMKVLDIGCGWGGFAKYAAEKYGVSVVGVTVSVEQAKLAKELCKGLPVSIRVQDYRLLNEKFDRIVSVGMIEHVGYKNYNTYMKVAHKCLTEDGLFLLHTIGSAASSRSSDPWTEKYIFPNGMLPSIAQLAKSVEKLFVVEDLHNFGADYDHTLMAWHKNFNANWKKISQNKDYTKRFYRMWNYYLLSCAGAFRARHIHLWQMVLAKKGIRGGHKSVR